MLHENVTKDLFLPELKLLKIIKSPQAKYRIFLVEKYSDREYCPKCGLEAKTIYDHVTVTVKDSPIRNKNVILKIRKRRFLCKGCKSVFREPVQGIYKGFRTTQRYRKHLMWCCSNFTNLKRVAKVGDCSEWLVYKAHYQELKTEVKKYQTPWPKSVGIDEHSFIRGQYGRKDFVTLFVDHNHKKVREVVYGRYAADILQDQNVLKIPGRENVKNVTIDLSSGFKRVAEDLFPKAIITADKFHVVKLLHPALQKYKREVIGRLKKNPFKNLLLKDGRKLKNHEKNILRSILHFYPTLKDVYTAKEAIHAFYRTKGYKQAGWALTRLTDWLAYSKIPELQTFRRTLRKWREEILNYFKSRVTNARTEGFNRKAKLIQRMAYGYKNFENYRLKILYVCRR